jgi:hypothetical protein
MSSKPLKGSQLRSFRSDVAKLKKLGLVSSRIDARSQKPTRYMRDQVKKFSDVLEGKAQVVKMPTRADAKKFEAMRTKGKAVVVPVLKGEKARYSKKTGLISGLRQRGANLIRRVLGIGDASKFKGPNVRYSIPLGRPGERWTFDSWEEIKAFFNEYEKGNRYPNWPKYVEIEIVS